MLSSMPEAVCSLTELFLQLSCVNRDRATSVQRSVGYSQEEVLHYFMVVSSVTVRQKTGCKHYDGVHSSAIVAWVKTWKQKSIWPQTDFSFNLSRFHYLIISPLFPFLFSLSANISLSPFFPSILFRRANNFFSFNNPFISRICATHAVFHLNNRACGSDCSVLSWDGWVSLHTAVWRKCSTDYDFHQ